MNVLIRRALLLIGLLALVPQVGWAQQKIGYIDSKYILQQTPQYEAVQQKIDRMAQQWRTELENQQEQVRQLKDEFQARELLYTEEERKQKQQEIRQAEQEVQQLRAQYFGPEGQLFSQQKQLMRPLQERILEAVEAVASREGYDYVFDKSGDYLFMYASDQHNLNEQVLAELGIDVDEESRGG